MKIKNISALGIAVFALALSACSGSQSTAVTSGNSASGKSNTATVTSANSTAANTAATNTTANTTSSAASSDSAGGQVINLSEAGVAVTVPSGMNFSKDGQDTIVKTEDNGVDTRFRVLNDDNMEKSFDEAFKEIGEYVTNAKLESKEPKKSSQNGLEVYSWGGTGKASNGDDVQFQLAIVDAGNDKKPLMALTYAENESLKEHQSDLAKFYQSIRKQ